VSTVDLFATVLELAGAEPATSSTEDSVSLVPYLHGAQRSQRSTLYSEGFVPNFTPDPSTGAPPASYVCTRHHQALRTARFKLIRRTARDHGDPNVILRDEEFFDLLRGGPPDISVFPPPPSPDPYEQNDLLLSGVPAGSVAERTLAALRALLDSEYPSLVQ
jgi:hypothetical protein